MTDRAVFDHLLLVRRDHRETTRLRRHLADTAAGGGAIVSTEILHETDGSCCQREPWAATFLAVSRDAVPGGIAYVRGEAAP